MPLIDGNVDYLQSYPMGQFWSTMGISCVDIYSKHTPIHIQEHEQDGECLWVHESTEYEVWVKPSLSMH